MTINPLRKISPDQLSEILSNALNKHFGLENKPKSLYLTCEVESLNFSQIDYEEPEEASLSLKFIPLYNRNLKIEEER